MKPTPFRPAAIAAAFVLFCGTYLPAASAQQHTPTAAVAMPMDDPPVNVRVQPLSEGDVTHEAEVKVADGSAPVIVRSIQPSSIDANQYRIDFDAMDADGDGYISREEAAANPALAAEFDALDTSHRGRLNREQLAGWLK